MPHPPCRGFTWLELLMVLVIVAILAAIAVPALSDAIARHRLRAAVTALTNTLQHAREASLYRPDGTVACPSANGRRCTGGTDWGVGWISRDRNTRDILAIEDALDFRLTAISTSTRAEVAFPNPASPGAGQPFNQTLALCVRGKAETTVTIVIARNGHSHVEPPSAEAARACGARHPRIR